MQTQDFITKTEREQICDHHCEDLMCLSSCPVWRKAEERRREYDRQREVHAGCEALQH